MTSTPETFERGLTKSIAHRKKELTDLRQLAQSAHIPDAVYRASVLIAYSHWEGFFKETVDRYVDHALSTCEGSQICDEMWAITYHAVTRELRNVDEDCAHFPDMRVYQKIRGASIESGAQWRAKKIQKNLTSAMASQTLRAIGLDRTMGLGDATWAVDMASKLDRELLERRNAVAHGELRPISREEAISFTDFVMKKLDQIGNFFLDAVDGERFRRTT